MDSDQDIEIEIIDKDSGMSSLGGSKDETPERRVIIVGHFIGTGPTDGRAGNEMCMSPSRSSFILRMFVFFISFGD